MDDPFVETSDQGEVTTGIFVNEDESFITTQYGLVSIPFHSIELASFIIDEGMRIYLWDYDTSFRLKQALRETKLPNVEDGDRKVVQHLSERYGVVFLSTDLINKINALNH